MVLNKINDCLITSYDWAANVTVDTLIFIRKGLQLDMNDKKIINS